MKEREFVVDSGASMQMVSRKDLNSAGLETVRASKKSDDGGNSQRRGANKRRGNSVCQSDSNASRRYSSRSLTRKNSAKITDIPTFGPVVKKTHLTKNGRKIDCNTANYVLFVVPGLSTSSSSSATPTSPTSVPQEAVIPTLHPASARSESTSSRA